jgi:protein-S-isoprenylcysteine O-methyltransferase Ste14
MMKKILEQTKHEYSHKQRLIALVGEAVFFVVVLPFVLVTLGTSLDRWLRLLPIHYQPINRFFGWLLIVTGWFVAMWAIYVQFTLGRGTPVPLMATQKLIVQPPYTYCRNPMTLGTIVMYLGVAILFGSVGALLLVMLGTLWLLIYIKRIEEKEMELRFKQEYLEYKQRTPFLIPRLRRKR